MAVKRIVSNFGMPDPDKARAFYHDILGLNVVMDHGWIITFGSDATTTPQISIASEGGSGTPVPDISIEVDDVDSIYEKVISANCEIVYALCDEEWGVRRFYVRDPAGKVLNILSHKE
jgi:catechol 2,3-dioxygenase-like lactoylglutathione lyase family enzyme